MKHYAFNADIASKYGINGAIMIYNLAHWTEKNMANEKNYYDGHYWVYNTHNAFSEIFPFWTTSQIKYILKQLKEKGAIFQGNYNKAGFDKTGWYALSDDVLELCDIQINRVEQNSPIEETKLSYRRDKIVLSKGQNSPMEGTNLSHGRDNIVSPIPYINTDNKHNINNNTFVNTSCDDNSPPKIVSVPYDKIIDEYNKVCISLPKVQKVSDKRKRLMRTLFKTLKGDLEQIYKIFELAEKSDFLTGRIGDRNWTAHFDWLIEKDKPIKILEGIYNNRDKPQKASKFVNYDQRTYDFNDLEKKAFELQCKE
ncbi:MAG: hypothetical protein N4A63_02295 [Vallitalea sp.]|jgi:hypothetical protein|nr:hypothetical protein [Vallitalea sp.]